MGKTDGTKVTEPEFNIGWEVMYASFRIAQHSDGSGDPDVWKKHIIDNIHILHMDLIEMISNNEPFGAGWSPEVVSAAQGYIIETMLLKAEQPQDLV